MNRLAIIRRRREACDWPAIRLRCENLPETDRGSSLIALAALVLALVLAGRVHGDLKIVGPEKAEPYRIVQLRAEGAPADAAFIWDASPEEQADIMELPGGRLLLTGPPGIYKVKVRSVRLKDGQTLIETARTTITIGKAPPGPDPPVPPDPTDPFVKALQAAYDAEADTAKADQLKKLTSLYRMSGEAAFLAKATTWGELFDAMSATATATGLQGKLLGIQKVIQPELQKLIPARTDTPLDADGRARAAAAFKKITVALEGVK